MSTQTSTARVEANRRNAQRSTGPRTTEGKARSSRNALTHGLLSESQTRAALGPITHPDHTTLLTALAVEFQPFGTIETALVASLASLRYRLNRITAIESGLFENSMTSILEYHAEYAAPGQATINDCLDAPIPSLLAEAYGRQSPTLNLLTFYEARLNREFHRALAELRRTQALRFASAPAEQLQENLIASTPIKVEPIPTEQCPTPPNSSRADTAKSTDAVPTQEKEQTNPTLPQTSEIADTIHPDIYASDDMGRRNKRG